MAARNKISFHVFILVSWIAKWSFLDIDLRFRCRGCWCGRCGRNVMIRREDAQFEFGTGGALAGAVAGNGFSRKCRSEEHTSELQSLRHLVCRLLLEKKNK